MDDETTINERAQRVPLTRFEWQEKKKSFQKDLTEIINRHGFDSVFGISDWILSEFMVSAMYQTTKLIRELAEQKPVGKETEEPFPHCSFLVRDRSECPGFKMVAGGWECEYRDHSGKCHSSDRMSIWKNTGCRKPK